MIEDRELLGENQREKQKQNRNKHTLFKCFQCPKCFHLKASTVKANAMKVRIFFDSHLDRVSSWKTGRNDFPKPKVLLIAMISGVKFENNKEVSSEYCYKLSIMYPTRENLLYIIRTRGRTLVIAVQSHLF